MLHWHIKLYVASCLCRFLLIDIRAEKLIAWLDVLWGGEVKREGRDVEMDLRLEYS